MNSFFPRQVFGRSYLKLWYLIIKVVLQVRSIHIEVVHCLLGQCRSRAATSDYILVHRLLHCVHLLSPSSFSAWRWICSPIF